MGNNTFAYCNNNPVIRNDSTGTAFETAWDILSLASSIADVAANPTSFWAWAGLAGDFADVCIPCVGGIGELTKSLGAANKARKMVDSTYETVDTASDIVKVSSNPVVIGDSMDRVRSFSEVINADYYCPTPGLSNVDTLLENRQWLEKVMSQNRIVYDIGIDYKKQHAVFFTKWNMRYLRIIHALLGLIGHNGWSMQRRRFACCIKDSLQSYRVCLPLLAENWGFRNGMW